MLWWIGLSGNERGKIRWCYVPYSSCIGEVTCVGWYVSLHSDVECIWYNHIYYSLHLFCTNLFVTLIDLHNDLWLNNHSTPITQQLYIINRLKELSNILLPCRAMFSSSPINFIQAFVLDLSLLQCWFTLFTFLWTTPWMGTSYTHLPFNVLFLKAFLVDFRKSANPRRTAHAPHR